MFVSVVFVCACGGGGDSFVCALHCPHENVCLQTRALQCCALVNILAGGGGGVAGGGGSAVYVFVSVSVCL